LFLLKVSIFLNNVCNEIGTIIGTWQERGNSMFWSVLGKQPLPSQALMCWKSLTVLHKILREGHPNVSTLNKRVNDFIL